MKASSAQENKKMADIFMSGNTCPGIRWNQNLPTRKGEDLVRPKDPGLFHIRELGVFFKAILSAYNVSGVGLTLKFNTHKFSKGNLWDFYFLQ
jgi:hypothetical protein